MGRAEDAVADARGVVYGRYGGGGPWVEQGLQPRRPRARVAAWGRRGGQLF